MPDKQTLFTWQSELAKAITSPLELYTELRLDLNTLPKALLAAQAFKCKVPRGYLQRIVPGNPHDPLLLELLPKEEELMAAPGFSHTPLEEKQFNPIPGLLHKYQGRVLILMTSVCAVHCRYCFRRNFPYDENFLTPQNWQAILEYLKSHTDIEEVIFSGGDPLTVHDNVLKKRLNDLEDIPHLRWVRFHTRLPVFIPNRITDEFLQMMQTSRLSCVMVLHVNHPNSLKDEILQEKLQAAKAAGITLLNQSVLLKNINDSSAVLADLSRALFSAGILPYYLHLLDKVKGSHHFDVDEIIAVQLVKELMRQLPGYLVPKLVREIPGELNKAPITIYR